MRSSSRPVMMLLLSFLSFVAIVAVDAPSHAGGPGSKPAARYTVTDLGTLGGTQSFAYAINNSGQIVGQSSLPVLPSGATPIHTFLYRKGTMTDLSPFNSSPHLTFGPFGINDGGVIASGLVVEGIFSPALLDSKTGEITVLGSLGGVLGDVSLGDAFSGVASSVNNSGQAVGYSFVDSRFQHAFFYSDGVMTDLGAFGAEISVASGINDLGMIVGSFGFLNGTAHSFSSHVFIYRGGQVIEIDPLGNGISSASAVNNKGQVIGSGLTDTGGSRGFIYQDGSITDIGTLEGGRNSFPSAINERGQVVGTADRPDPTCSDPSTCARSIPTAVLYENGELKDLNSLIPAASGWDLSYANGINNRGHITGYGVNNGRFRAFVLTPVKRHNPQHGAEGEQHDDQDQGQQDDDQDR